MCPEAWRFAASLTVLCCWTVNIVMNEQTGGSIVIGFLHTHPPPSFIFYNPWQFFFLAASLIKNTKVSLVQIPSGNAQSSILAELCLLIHICAQWELQLSSQLLHCLIIDGLAKSHQWMYLPCCPLAVRNLLEEELLDDHELEHAFLVPQLTESLCNLAGSSQGLSWSFKTNNHSDACAFVGLSIPPLDELRAKCC